MICWRQHRKLCGRCLRGNHPVVVLRPEPGNRATIARLTEAGIEALAIPLFAVQPLDWTMPDPAEFDALILTSANAVRWAGKGLTLAKALPVYTVGEATAAAARAAGIDVITTGNEDASALLATAKAAGVARALHLGGRDSTITPGTPPANIIRQSIAVYASDPVPVSPRALAELIDGVALLHSPRAARQLAALIDTAGFARHRITLAALSAAVAAAAGPDWQVIWTAPVPTDAALVNLVDDRLRAG